jgi:hypothetical protein
MFVSGECPLAAVQSTLVDAYERPLVLTGELARCHPLRVREAGDPTLSTSSAQ